jgi:hypothetical protein
MKSLGACYEESQRKLKMLEAICSRSIEVEREVVLRCCDTFEESRSEV